jgi:hypothetical protein
MIASPSAMEVIAITTNVKEKLPLLRETSRLARKNSVFNGKKSLICKSSAILMIRHEKQTLSMDGYCNLDDFTLSGKCSG